jgi:hypothetical protein
VADEEEVDTAPEYDADGFHNLATARFAWSDAPYEDTLLQDLLDIAKSQVEAYSYPISSTSWVGQPSLRLGQLMQARNIWNAQKVDPSSGGMGEDGFVMRPFPLDWMVRQILRPKRGKPVMF